MPEFCLEFEKPLVELRRQLAEMSQHCENNNMQSPALDALKKELLAKEKEVYSSLSPWQKVQLSRHPERPYTLDYVEALFTDFVELRGDRRFADDHAIIGGFAKFDDRKIMVIGTQKGRDMKSNVYRNFGWPSPEGYRKALRLMKLAEKANVPIVSFIDTPGAFPGIASEERHIAEAIALNLREMFALTVPVIAIIIGEGGSGGAIGIGVGNRILIMEHAYYSVITPEGCAAILWKDRKFASQAADALKLTSDKLKELGIADGVIKEPFGGAHRDFEAAAKFLGDCLRKNLNELSKVSAAKLKDQRYQKFRRMGEFIERKK